MAACGTQDGRVRFLGAATGIVIALATANCASGPPSSRSASSGGVDPKYGVRASPRVVADGDAVPKGGGKHHIGRPYRVAGRTYVPNANPSYSRVGLASWYGAAFHGRRTSNGEVFDRYSVSAAHPTLPLPSYARVTNTYNGRSMVVRINDRGPFHGNRIIDVSERVAQALDFKSRGTASVRVDYMRQAGLRGSDDSRLMASLRTDGAMASLDGITTPSDAPVQVASAAETAPVTARITSRVQPATAFAAAPESVAVPSASETSSNVTVVGRTAPTGVTVAYQTVAAPGVPLPPDRPFDLGTIPGAATPMLTATAPGVAPVDIGVSAPLPPSRVASLFFADPVIAPTRFERGTGPFAGLTRQNFVRFDVR